MPTPETLSPTPTPASAVLAQAPGYGQVVLMIVVLIVVLVGVLYATRLFARLAQRSVTRPNKRGMERSIYLIDRLMLDKDKSLVLVEEGDRRYFLGVTPNEITLLKEAEAPEPPPGAAMEQGYEGAHKPATFQELFRAWKERGKE